MPMVKGFFGLGPAELCEDREHHWRRELLRGKPVATADDRDAARLGFEPSGQLRFAQCGHDVNVQRLADSARLLGAVEHGDRADGWRKCGRKGSLTENGR